MSAVVPVPSAATDAEASPDRFPRAPFGAGDAVVLVAFALMAIAPLAWLVVRAWDRGGVVTGGDGYLVADPLQYLNWLRQAGSHVAAGNLYDLASGPRSFVHPLVLVSGLLYDLGAGVVVAYYAWLPVAILTLFWGTYRLAGRYLARAGDRRIAVIVALFFASPVAAIVGWGGIGGLGTKFQVDFATGEIWAGSYIWGYLFTAIAVGAMPLGLLAYERGRAGKDRRSLGLAAALGLLVAWLQPWQGITMAFVLVVAEAWLLWRERDELWRRVLELAVPLAAIALPLLYYLVLSRKDDAWHLAGVVNDIGHWPLWVTVVTLAPLAIPAAFAYRLPAPDFGALALRAWPFAGVIVYYQPLGTFPAHAFQGLALPLAVLSVLAVRHARGDRPLPVVAVVLTLAVLLVPGTVYRADQLHAAVTLGRQPFLLTTGERDALRWMEHADQPGGVLTPVYSGLLVPAYTGRESYIGAGSWTPDFATRQQQTEDLLAGRLSPAASQALVRATGPAFVYADCHDRADITRQLGDVIAGPPLRFGCARVWRVRPQYVRDLG